MTRIDVLYKSKEAIMNLFPRKFCKVLFLIPVIFVGFGAALCAAVESEEVGQWVSLELSDRGQSQWAFVGGEWGQNAEGEIGPPLNAVDGNLVFYTR